MSRQFQLPKLAEFRTSYILTDFASEDDVKNLVENIRVLCLVGKFLQKKADVMGVEHEGYSFEFPTWDEITTEIKSEQDAEEFLTFTIGLYNAQYQYLQELEGRMKNGKAY